jgi:alpha-tubulin suppressor-like RCC1 family protein
LTLPVAILACTDATSPAPAASLVLSPDSIVAERGDTLRFTAAILDAHDNPVPGRTVRWASSDTAVAVIGTAGIGIARGPGGAWVRATADGIADSARVTVRIPVASVTIAPRGLAGVVGGTLPLHAVLRDSAGGTLTARATSWTSSDTMVGVVSDSGVLSFRTLGSVVVTAGAGAKSDTARFTARTVTFRELRPSELGHTCAISTDTLAFCWGGSGLGEVGTGVGYPPPPPLSPTSLSGGMRFLAITTGEGFSCGIATDSLAYCWGYPARARLGNGTLVIHYAPFPVSGNLAFRSIDAGHSHTCALTASAAAYCWGDNSGGDLGTGVAGLGMTPQAVAGGLRFRSISTGQLFTCALTADSLAYCWGSSLSGELGTGSSTDDSLPTPVMGGLKFSVLSVGDSHTCGLVAGGVADCWGSNVYGELGDSTTTSRGGPVAVAGGITFTAITAGGDHGDNFTCGLTASGVAYCWGYGGGGELGNGADTSATVPVPVAGGLIFASIVAGGFHVCGLTTGGVAYCWGYNISGELGDGTTGGRNVPTRVLGQP